MEPVVIEDFVEIREATAGDGRALAGVFAESWLATYRGIIPHQTLTSMISRRDIAWWSKAARASQKPLVLAINGEVVGYASVGPARIDCLAKGEIYELYLAPAYQGLGFGERLFETCRYRLDSAGLDGLIVWALNENEAAIDFYIRRGGRPKFSSSEHFGGRKVPKTGLVWR